MSSKTRTDPVASLNREERKKIIKQANRACHRLLSIRYDYYNVVLPTIALYPALPVVCNERCGTWYTRSPSPITSTCYFKSTDGHVWNFSLKRLNLDLIQKLADECSEGSLLLLDASKSKEMPDSFSRTIPIWCAVLNRIVVRFRHDMGLSSNLDTGEPWDVGLYTPWVISSDEHSAMVNILDDRVDLLYKSHAIVDPVWLVTILKRPLRPFWITPHRREVLYDGSSSAYYSIICMNCSEYHPDRCWKGTFWYTPGAADDHELWGRKLIPRLFWENMNEILMEPLIDEEVEATIDRIVAADALMEANNTNNDTVTDLQGDFDAIGEETGIYIGTRRAGRPPQCWKTFDAIVNVTDMEYPDFTDNLPLPEGKWYLQLPVKEGKRDKTELERWMPVAIIFCLSHLQSKRRVLIHCAQGKDRSVAIAMAVMMLSCELHYPLQCRKDLGRLSLEDLLDSQTNVTFDDDDTLYHYSGLTTRLVDTLLDRQGGTIVLDWYHSMMGLADEVSLATKETIRIALHLIQQYREKADPTRSTMQKLHRFFMSSPHLPNP